MVRGSRTVADSTAYAAYPHEIRSLRQVEKLPFIGVKITGLVRCIPLFRKLPFISQIPN